MLDLRRAKYNFLISFAYYDASIKEVLNGTFDVIDWMIDSGAYTNDRIKRKQAIFGEAYKANYVMLDDYIAECRNFFAGRVWEYIALDVIRNPEKTTVNLKKMSKAGLHPMPVFVEHMKAKDLKWLLDINERICVAGAGQYGSIPYLRRRYAWIKKETDGRAKVHALGLGHRAPHFFNMAIKSGDSTTWRNGMRYGEIRTYDPGKLKWTSTRQLFLRQRGQSGELTTKDHHVLARLRKYGITAEMVFGNKPKYNKSWGSISSIVSMFESLRYAVDCRRHERTYVFAVSDIDSLLMFAAIVLTLKDDSQ